MLTAPAKSFSDFPLSSSTQSAVASMGITSPTPIQIKAIPILLAGRDVIGQARTGSGKTLAFALPIVERCDPKVRGVQAMVLVPTRELAIQVGGVLGALAAARHLQITLLFGGRAYSPERNALARGAQIVVGTPGRTLDHLNQGTLVLRNLKVFVLDEGDEMLDQGFAPDVERILSKTPATRQTALFSATVPAWVNDIAARHLRDPQVVRVDNELEAPAEIKHTVYTMQPDVKLGALCTLLDNRRDGPILVFGRTKHGVKKLADRLSELDYPVTALQGNLSQNARQRVMEQFRSGEVSILVATNVAARGLDVAGIEQVINYDLPDNAQLFTHRIGRTGRMGRQGEAVTFLTPDDGVKWRQIERELGRTLPRQAWPRGQGATASDRAPMMVAQTTRHSIAGMRPARTPAPVAAHTRVSNPMPRRGAAPSQAVRPPARRPIRPQRSTDPRAA